MAASHRSSAAAAMASRAPIGRLVHAARPGRKFIHQVIGAAEPASDLAGAPVCALASAFELGFVPEPMAMPAPEARPAVQDAASAIAVRAPEPPARSAERCRRRPDFDALVDDLG